VLLYPELIWIRVGLDNGRVTGFLAEGSRAGPGERDIAAPAVTREEALGAVPEALTVERYDLALLTGPGGEEVLRHVFQARSADGQAFLVYVSAQSGRQQEIRLLVEDERGHFVAPAICHTA
jgi:hypothetical protein